MQLAEPELRTTTPLERIVQRPVAAILARGLAASQGFAEEVAHSFTVSVERDPTMRDRLLTSALSSPALKQALIRKLSKELS